MESFSEMQEAFSLTSEAVRGRSAASAVAEHVERAMRRADEIRPARDALAELADHPSDSQVKPIVLNRRIEAVPESHYDPNALPFEHSRPALAGCAGSPAIVAWPFSKGVASTPQPTPQ